MAVHPIHMAGCPGHVVQTACPEGVQWSKRVNHNKQMVLFLWGCWGKLAWSKWSKFALAKACTWSHWSTYADDAGVSVSYWHRTLPPTNRKDTVCSNLIFQCFMLSLTINPLNPLLKINLKMNWKGLFLHTTPHNNQKTELLFSKNKHGHKRGKNRAFVSMSNSHWCLPIKYRSPCY